MRRYNILQPFWMAFYSKSLYQDIRQHWEGFVFTYLLIFILVCNLPLAYRLHNHINHLVQNLQPWIAQLPTFTIRNGKLSINKPVPYYIKYPDQDQIFAIIDTSGTITSLEKTEAKMLFTSTQIIVKHSHSVKTYNLTTLKNPRNQLAVYTPQAMSSLAQKFNLLIFLLYPIIVMLYFFQGILEALIYALLAKFFIKTELPYKLLFRLAIVAITPKLIIASLLSLFAITLPYKWVLFFALGMGYLFFAIEANRGEQS